MVDMDRYTKTDYETQKSRLIAIWERYDRPLVVAEENSMGGPVIESLRKAGMNIQPFVTTNASKQEIIDGLALSFERHDITILDDATLVGELEAYESKRLPSGKMSYNAPENMHDDCVMSLAIAWNAATKPRGVLVY